MNAITNKQQKELDLKDSTVYAKLVPTLLEEVSSQQKLLNIAKQEQSKNTETLKRLYKDYQDSLSKEYRLQKEVNKWKRVTFGVCLLLISFVLTGAFS